MVTVTLLTLSQQLESLFQAQSYDAGFALGRHILRWYPRHLDTYALLGQNAFIVALYEDAADALRRALSCDPEDGALWTTLRRAASALGLSAEAELAGLYERDLLRMGHAPGMQTQARQAAAERAWPTAVRLYRTAFTANRFRMDVGVGYAHALFHTDRYEASQAVALFVLQQLPHCLKAHWLAALCAGALGDRDTQLHHLRVARTIDPDDVHTWEWFDDERTDLPDQPPAATLPAWDENERWG